MDLYNKNKESHHLVGLLMLYRDYAPHLVTGTFPLVSPSIFRHPSLDTVLLISSIQAKYRSGVSNHSVVNRSRLTHARKRQKLLIPDIQTAATEQFKAIEDIFTLSNFVDNIHRIRFPLQMASVLGEFGMLTRLLVCKNDDVAWERLNNWLANTLHNEKDDPRNLQYLLSRVLRLVEYTKVSVVVLAVRHFLISDSTTLH
jgi:hypothetical protein